MIKKTYSWILLLLLMAGGFSSCIHDDFDQPPVGGTDPNLTVTTTIADLKAMYTGTRIQITDSLIISGIVVADDKSGNFYKAIVIQDTTAGILLRMDQSNLYADYPVGRKVYVNLYGLYMGEYGGLIQLGGAPTVGSTTEVDYIPSALFDKHVIKATLNNPVTPIPVTIDMLDNSYQNMLIRIDNVEVMKQDTDKTYADALLQQSRNVNVSDCAGNMIIMRSSGYATFAGQPLPNGNGSITAVYSVFGTDKQLIIRDTYDVELGGARCPEPYLDKDFEDGSVTSGGWTIQQVTGPSITWTVNTQGAQNGVYYAQCRNYIAPNNIPCETWLISPAIDLSAATNPVLSFMTACNYNGAALQVLISEDYDGTSLPATATWTNVPCAVSSGSWAWTNSGNISVLPLLGGFGNNVHIAFKYTGTNSDGKTWELDDILMDEM